MNRKELDRIEERSSNFELLRIISILLIIAYHYCVHGNHNTIFKSEISINQMISVLLGSWGLLGVECFIFISSYFLLDSRQFRTKKLVHLIFQTIFYSVCIAAFLKLCTNVEIGKKELIKSLLSPFNSYYWFVTAYCLLYIVSPFLNNIIHNMNPKYFIRFLIVLTFLVPVYRTIIKDAPVDDFLFVIYLYFVMGYLKKHPGNWFETHARTGFPVTSGCIILYHIALSSLGTIFDLEILKKNAHQLATRYSPVMVLDAVFLFYLFKNLNMKHSKIINTLAGTTLGIYLFHENPLLKKILWDEILNIEEVYYSKLYIVYFLLSVIVLYVIGACIDMIRIRVFEKSLSRIKVNWIEALFYKFDSWINLSA